MDNPATEAPIRHQEGIPEPHTLLEGPHTPLLTEGETRLTSADVFSITPSLLEKLETLPLEVQEEAKSLLENNKTRKEDFDGFLKRARTTVQNLGQEPEKITSQMGVLDELGKFDASNVKPKEMVGALRDFIETKGANLTPEEQTHATEIMDVLNALGPELDQVQAHERDEKELPAALKEKLSALTERLKKPLKLLGLGIIGFFFMFIFQGIKSVATGGQR